jgi:hypothetical protein
MVVRKRPEDPPLRDRGLRSGWMRPGLAWAGVAAITHVEHTSIPADTAPPHETQARVILPLRESVRPRAALRRAM